jgi:hypothetical protein
MKLLIGAVVACSMPGIRTEGKSTKKLVRLAGLGEITCILQKCVILKLATDHASYIRCCFLKYSFIHVRRRVNVNYIYNPIFLEVPDFPEPPTSASSADKYLQRSITLQGS